MIDQRKRIFAVNMSFVDLALTKASFVLPYCLRTVVELEGNTVLQIQEYLWFLAIILPVWALMLRMFSVY